MRYTYNIPLAMFMWCVCHVATAESGPYLEFGVVVFDDYASQPEVTLQSPTGTIDIGWQFRDGWSAGIEHESSIPMQEQGSAINGVFIRKRLWFNNN